MTGLCQLHNEFKVRPHCNVDQNWNSWQPARHSSPLATSSAHTSRCPAINNKVKISLSALLFYNIAPPLSLGITFLSVLGKTMPVFWVACLQRSPFMPYKTWPTFPSVSFPSYALHLENVSAHHILPVIGPFIQNKHSGQFWRIRNAESKSTATSGVSVKGWALWF